MSDTNDRFVITPDDKAGVVVIVTAIGLSWTVLTLIIRVVSRLHIKRSIGIEEALVIAASSCASVASICILVAVKYGFGRRGISATSSEEETILKLLWTSDIFYILTLGIAKAATLPLLMRLTPIKQFVRASWVMAGFLCAWCIISIFLVAIRCDAASPWNDATEIQCSSMFSRWAFIEVVSILFEVLVFGLFLAIIRILRMSMKTKVKVVFAFSTRLTVIIPTAFRLAYLQSDLQEPDPSFSLLYAVIAAQAVLHYTTIAASFAYLKPFLRAFDSNLGATVKVDTVVSTGYPQNRSHDHSSRDRETKRGRLTSFATASKTTTVNDDIDEQDEMTPRTRALNPSFGSNTLPKRVSHRKNESGESVTPIITKTQEWTVRTEPRDASLHDV